MATNKPKDSSHKSTNIVGDEDEQLFVLERLTMARKEMNVHNLHVPDLDTLILNRVEALERNPFGRVLDEVNAVQNAIGDNTSVDHEKNSFLLNRVLVCTSNCTDQGIGGIVRITFDEERKTYSVLPPPGPPKETFTGFTFSPEEVTVIRLLPPSCVGIHTNGERKVMVLWFADEEIANAEEVFVRRLEEQTGLPAEKTD